ncbi:uncharacterized protein LOC133181389 [Saccostrea echinata]|uniref:uncharacterized protein LOC133181389 n=1 Tax=Saccostrea echinata TaxID=191078 RepID=UPI002A8162CE|nr:uncharacterized protein LOC133181389 [Saccostrea echinata]
MKEGKELYCDAGYTCCNQGNGKCCGPDFVCGIDGACIALAYLIFPPIITVFVLLIILCFCCYCCRKDKDKKQALDNEYPFAMNAYPPSHNVPPTGVPLSMISKLNKKTPVTPKPTKPVNKAEQFLGPSPKYRDDSDLPNSPAPPYLQPQGKSKGRHKDIY